MLSCFSSYSQRTVYMFEPDYTIDYCVHELLYAGERENGTYPVLYADFFSKNVLENGYTRSTMREFKNKKTFKTTTIFYNKNGLIRSVDIKLKREKKTYRLDYTYSNDNRTIAVTHIPSKIRTTFYFNNRMLIDSVTDDWSKITYLYDSLNMLVHVQRIILETGFVQNREINYGTGRLFYDSSNTPVISKTMKGLSPEALGRVATLEDKNYSRLGIFDSFNTAEFFRTDSSVFFRHFKSTSRFDMHNIASFYQWNSQGNLVRYAYYHSDDGLKLTFTYGDHYARSAKRLHITHFTPTEKEELRRKIKKGKIELLHSTISYHK
jgi:hypothetical protein